ncbi:hypothetical protein KUCAC02_037796 [Chaenocephalus aceratus]|nr:hypothetical protein KUCAC02_037796 [Chaenocephalus aceratus]
MPRAHKTVLGTTTWDNSTLRALRPRGTEALNPSHLPPEEAGESGTRRAHGGRPGRGRHNRAGVRVPSGRARSR